MSGHVSAHEEIRNLLGTYSEVLDAGDWAGLGRLFARAELQDEKGRTIARGADQVTGLWSRMVRLHDGSPRTRHLVSGPVITVDGATATCRSAFLVLQLVPGKALEPISAGRYRDAFACTDGAWHFTTRQFLLDQEGDMAMHLVDL